MGTLDLCKMATLKNKTIIQLWQVANFAIKGVENFSKFNRVPGRYTFQIMCHNIEVDITNT